MKTVEQIVEEVASKTTGGLAVPLTNAVKEWMTHAVNAYIAEQEKSDNLSEGLPIDPTPYVFQGIRHSEPDQYGDRAFKPGKGYSQNREDYKKEKPKSVRDVIEENGGTTPTVQGWA